MKLKRKRYGLRLAEIEPGQILEWNWCGGVDVIVKRKVGNQVEIQVLGQFGNTAKVYPQSLRRPRMRGA